MAHSIKISGISDELLTRVDQRWKGRHYADRSEYVRDLIRRDILDEPAGGQMSITEGIQTLFRGIRKQELGDAEIADDIASALAEVRAARRKRV